MKLEIIVGIQVGLLLVGTITFLVFYILKQKKTIANLKELFAKLKDDLGGMNVAQYLQEAEKQTLSISRRSAAIFDPSLPVPEQAVALRYSALRAEILHIDNVQRGNGSLESALAPYGTIAAQIEQFINRLREELKGQIAVDSQHKLSELHRSLDAAQRKNQDLEESLGRLKPLLDVLSASSNNSRSKDEVEQMLHQAMTRLCDVYDNARTVREVIYLYHEAYFDRQQGYVPAAAASSGGVAFDSADGRDLPVQALSFDPSQHIDMLNNIIDEQGQLLADMQNRIMYLQSGERADLEDKTEAIGMQVQEAKACIDRLAWELDKINRDGMIDYNSVEVMNVIEQFTEESATMVERLHMLSNQNKMLTNENEQLRAQLETGDGDNPLVSGLRARIQQQTDEIIQLQYNYRDLEEQYLSLYTQQGQSQTN